MRLIKMFGLAAVAAVAAMAFISATPASATNTQLCDNHAGLICEAGHAVTSLHSVLRAGAVATLLGAIKILCLGFLIEETALGLGSSGPQSIHTLNTSFSGCGTGSAHNDVTIIVLSGQQPLSNLLKTGLDVGVRTVISGRIRVVAIPIFGLECDYDMEGMELTIAGGHLTATETPLTELGGKFLCSDEGFLDVLTESLGSVHVLG